MTTFRPNRPPLICLFYENFGSVGSLKSLLVRINSCQLAKNSFIIIVWDGNMKAKAEDVCTDNEKPVNGSIFPLNLLRLCKDINFCLFAQYDYQIE